MRGCVFGEGGGGIAGPRGKTARGGGRRGSRDWRALDTRGRIKRSFTSMLDRGGCGGPCLWCGRADACGCCLSSAASNTTSLRWERVLTVFIDVSRLIVCPCCCCCGWWACAAVSRLVSTPRCPVVSHQWCSTAPRRLEAWACCPWDTSSFHRYGTGAGQAGRGGVLNENFFTTELCWAVIVGKMRCGGCHSSRLRCSSSWPGCAPQLSCAVSCGTGTSAR
jgi:hypothetical protein